MSALILATVIAWLPPAEREDGAAFAESEVLRYEVRYNCGANEQQIVTTTAARVTLQLSGVCRVAVRVVDQSGLVSEWSEAKEFTGRIGNVTRGGIR